MVLNSIKNLARDKSGNFAMMTVIAFPMLFAGVAFAVDVSNNLRLRTDLQNANDTAVLYATRFYQETKTLPTKTQVQQFIQANLSAGLASNVNFTFDVPTNVMTLSSETTSDPILMNYFYNGKTKVSVLSKAKLGVSGILEFSLALDTTWSMNDDGKMAGLKVAATQFVNLLMEKKAQGADVKGAIVPFANYVNVGVSRRSATWMNVPADIDTRKTWTESVTTRPVVGETNCRNETKPASVIQHPAQPASCWFEDGIQKCWSGSAAWTETIAASTSRVCDPVYGQPVTTTVTKKSGKLTKWNGCVSSRVYPDNVVEAYNNKKFPGVLDVKCTTELQPLTGSRTTLINKINALTPAGDTYVPEGVMWGARTLTNSLPFTEGKAADPLGAPLRKALIIMTDGQNSMQPYNDWRTPSMSANNMVHEGSWIESPANSGNWIPTSTVADGYTIEACNAAKAEGIEVYTISFGSAVPASVKTLLQNCASKSELYTHAADATGLAAAFNDIADDLLAVRLTQ